MNRPSINPMNVNIRQKKVADEGEETEQSNNTVKQQNNTGSHRDGVVEHDIVIQDLYALYRYTYSRRYYVLTGNYSRREFIRYFRIDPVFYNRVSKGLIKLYESKCPNLKKFDGFFRLEPVSFTYDWFKHIESKDQIQQVAEK